MSDTYQPPKVWRDEGSDAGVWKNLNRPVAGATHEKALPRGTHPLQLYSLGTPNGKKVTILLEELLAAGEQGAEYDAHIIRIGDGDQFGSGFVGVNPNSKIPALLDTSAQLEVRVFESGAILLYLAEKFGRFLPKNLAGRTEALNWLFWLQGSAPYVGGGFGHFYHYAPVKLEYPINRFTMETKRLLDVLNQRLAENRYLAGEEYSIADIATWTWYGGLVLGELYEAKTFIDADSYTHVVRWAQEIAERPAVRRGRVVNTQTLAERHDAADIDAVVK